MTVSFEALANRAQRDKRAAKRLATGDRVECMQVPSTGALRWKINGLVRPASFVAWWLGQINDPDVPGHVAQYLEREGIAPTTEAVVARCEVVRQACGAGEDPFRVMTVDERVTIIAECNRFIARWRPDRAEMLDSK